MKRYYLLPALLILSSLPGRFDKAGDLKIIQSIRGNDHAGAGEQGEREFHPGARYGSSSWTDRDGNCWVFGGNGYDATGALGLLNDLWMLNGATGEWTFIKGTKIRSQKGIYGTLGIPDINCIPGCRSYAVSWTDKEGNLLLFGGYGIDAGGNTGPLNDLWKYSISKNCWIWIQGNNLSNQSGQYSN
jgi:N-acetylneuraminic acid mutarotase